MKTGLGRIINLVIGKFGYSVQKSTSNEISFPVEATKEDKEIMRLVLKNNFTMVSVDNIWAAIASVKYIVENNIKGDIIECGVWRGGCSIAMALTLKRLKSSKKIVLYDTFEGMTVPLEIDKETATGKAAMQKYISSNLKTHNEWCYASIEDVKQNFIKCECIENVSFIKGDVLETLQNPINVPNSISLIRLDTDWYQSTKKELEVLFPLLQPKGVLLIDDYGYWDGSRMAVDEYFKMSGFRRPLIVRIDRGGRLALKI